MLPAPSKWTHGAQLCRSMRMKLLLLATARPPQPKVRQVAWSPAAPHQTRSSWHLVSACRFLSEEHLGSITGHEEGADRVPLFFDAFAAVSFPGVIGADWEVSRMSSAKPHRSAVDTEKEFEALMCMEKSPCAFHAGRRRRGSCQQLLAPKREGMNLGSNSVLRSC